MIQPQKPLAIFIPSLVGGGAERVTVNLAQTLAEQGYLVDLVLAQQTGEYLDAVPPAVRIVNLRSSGVLASLPALVRYLRRQRPWAMISTLTYANIVALWARRLAGISMPLMVTEHNTFSVVRRVDLRDLGLPWLAKRFYPWANYIVTVSKGAGNDLAQSLSLPCEQVTVIYNPVVTEQLRQRACEPLDHHWFAPDAPPVILTVGRLTEQKDFGTLIRAFAKVRSTRHVRLLILGEGAERQALEALVLQLGLEADVSLPGFVRNPAAFMARSALFALSSRWEGLPTVLIEALYCGTPVVATDCPSGPREILSDGRYGHLVPVGDVHALAQAMSKGLDGHIPRPDEESWRPFEQHAAAKQYICTLREESNA